MACWQLHSGASLYHRRHRGASESDQKLHIDVNSCPERANAHRTGFSQVLAAWLLLFSALHGYAGDKAYGEHFFRLGSSWPEAVLPSPNTGLTPSPESMARYQQQVQEFQESGGPYSDALAEPLEDETESDAEPT